MGAYVNGVNNTDAFEALAQKQLAVSMWYVGWNTSFPSSECDTVNGFGCAPMLTWEPALPVGNTLEAISDGNYDTYITNFANAAKNWGKLIYIRFAHEMNGNWYAWDGSHNGGSSGGTVKYIKAWKHVHAIFTSVGASNVKFVWSPDHKDTPAETWNKAVNYYPGDAYVDWIAFDGYNWGNGDWKSFDQVFSPIYATFEAYGKPMMIGEFACSETGGDKAAWITDALSKIKSNYPKVKMINWFNIDKERDWRIDSSTTALSAFQNAIQDSYFSGEKPTY